ncbi:hypothetical protein EOW65_03600 [Sinirhodobacter ferrireducens]|uniref:Uncharacterized protein n=1 Tax=Paenirhodobacter ferrireducens TaxID=1215032 RepID=A0A443LRZ6_9RHOB|nr:hypothetical protein [Sinirhodobacter ferrireducens]RWR51946.1 hypothetical protein EOW65_03600 [Sinirhodobacter ferrireducens]
MSQNDFKRGMSIALGGVAALVLVGAVVCAGVVGFQYINADHKRDTLVEELRAACVGAGSLPGPMGSSVVGQRDIQRAHDELLVCGQAQMKLKLYDAGISVDDL